MTSAERARNHARLTPPDDAVAEIVQAIGPRSVLAYLKPVNESIGLVLAYDIHASPPKQARLLSTVDGYALNEDDLIGAEPLMAEFERLDHRSVTIRSKQVVRVLPGSPLPLGSGSVIARAGVRENSASTIVVTSVVTPGENTTPDANDFAVGNSLMRRGKRIGPLELGLLLEHGFVKIPVVQPPRVAVVSLFGDNVSEAQNSNEALNVDARSASIGAALSWLGAHAIQLKWSATDEKAIQESFLVAAETYDSIIVIGSLSRSLLGWISSKDVSRTTICGIRSKPGRSTVLSVIKRCPIAILSGTTSTNLAVFLNVIAPLFEKLFHVTSPSQCSYGVAGKTLVGKAGWTFFIPVRFGNGAESYQVFPTGGAGRIIHEAYARMDGFVRIDSNEGQIKTGQHVCVSSVPK